MNVKMLLKRGRGIVSRWVAAPEYVYLAIALVSVISFAIITPPFQGPDEEAHYVRTQYIAHGYFIPIDVKNSPASLPSSLEDTLYLTFFKDDIRGNTNNKYEPSRTSEALLMAFDKDSRYKPAMVTYSPVPYLPAVPGVFLSNLLNLSPLFSMYIARLSLGIVAILLIFYAIKLIPHKKYLFAAVGLIPMLLFQQAVVTADSVSYALLALFVAYILYLRDTKKITRNQWLLLGLICIGVTLAKPLLYLFLPLVLILIKKQAALKWIAGIAAVCVIVLFGWIVATSSKTETVIASGTPDDIDSKQQLETLISDPKRVLRVAWNSYMTTFGDDEVRGVIGIFGAADTIYPLWMVTTYTFILGLLFSVNFEKKRVQIDRVWKWLAIVLCVGYFVAVNLALYLSYTPVNFDIVYGVQGRYFLPILIVAAAAIFTGGFRIVKDDITKLKYFTVISIAVLILLALLITIQRYYLYTP